DCQDVPLFGAARLCAIQGSGAAEARTARSGHRRDLRSRQDGAAEAMAYGEADFRTAADRTRICRRLRCGLPGHSIRSGTFATPSIAREASTGDSQGISSTRVMVALRSRWLWRSDHRALVNRRSFTDGI